MEKVCNELILNGSNDNVDGTYLLSMPTEFQGKEEDSTGLSLKMKAYLGAIDPKYNELLKIAEDPERSLHRGDATANYSSFSRCS